MVTILYWKVRYLLVVFKYTQSALSLNNRYNCKTIWYGSEGSLIGVEFDILIYWLLVLIYWLLELDFTINYLYINR